MCYIYIVHYHLFQAFELAYIFLLPCARRASLRCDQHAMTFESAHLLVRVWTEIDRRSGCYQ